MYRLSHNLSTDVFIAGAGPAACGLLLNVERSGKLQNILEGSQIPCGDDETQHSIVMVDKASDHSLGRGQLGKYLCPSNTSASCLLKILQGRTIMLLAHHQI